MARKFPKASTLYLIGALVCLIFWIIADDTEFLILLAWFSITSKLEEMTESRSAPPPQSVWVTMNQADWSRVTMGPRNGTQ